MTEPYGQYAARYLEAGFAPIPARGKNTRLNGHHGRGKPWVTEEEAALWARRWPTANIAARLPRDVIGIDVDAYDEKLGKQTLEALEEELGTLPRTLVSTSRHDGISGIRLFRIPDRYWSVIWPGKAGPGVDIIWMGNRYIVAWPSLHPDSGEQYLWYQQNGSGLRVAKRVPDLDKLPEFPAAWCDYFAKTEEHSDLADVADTVAWLRENGGGEMCPLMAENVERAVDDMPAGAHDAARDAVLAICRDAARGHTGAWIAAKRVLEAFTAEMKARSPARAAKVRSEWRRSLDGAVRHAAGIKPEGTGDPCQELLNLGLSDIQPTRYADNIIWADDVEETRVDWLQKPLLAFGSIVMTDGDPSQGKTLLTQNAVAQAARGLPLFPFGEHCGRPIKCGIIGAEDDLESVVRGRLRAAGYVDGSRSVAFIKLNKKRGKPEQLTFPEGTNMVRDFIVRGGLELVVVDPITSFLGEDVKSHVDASVRAALGPLAEIARQTGCCIWLVRHLNKDGSMKAIYRGGGSIAFSALARSGMITGRMPDESGWFGIAQVKCNHARKMDVTLAYSIEAWEEDPDIPVIEWHGEAEVTPDELVSGPKGKPGPASDLQAEISDALTVMFDQKDTWEVGEAKTQLRAAGISANDKTIAKARKSLGIISGQTFDGNGRISAWVWTTNVKKLRGRMSA